MNTEGFTKLWKNYIGGKMVYIGGIGLLVGATADHLAVSLVSAIYIGSGAIVYKLEGIQQDIQEVQDE